MSRIAGKRSAMIRAIKDALRRGDRVAYVSARWMMQCPFLGADGDVYFRPISNWPGLKRV